MNLKFRTIESKDYDICAEILVDAYAGEPWNNQWTKEEALLRITTTMSGSNALGYVAMVNDEIIGTCLGRVDYYNAGWKQFCVDELNVSPSFHSEGVGSVFMSYIKKIMEQEGMNRIFLMTGGELSRKFYEKNGYEKNDEATMLTLDLKD